MIRLFLPSPAATGCLGRALATLLSPPAVVTLAGELGTGKTTLVRDVLRAAGVWGPVVSPSFTIAQSYSGRAGVRFNHLDLYRLSPGADVELFAWDDYLTPDAVTLVEWPEAGSEELPGPDVAVRLYHHAPRSRWAEIESAPAIEERLASLLRDAGLPPQLSLAGESVEGGAR
jgi:tRNA threonylcarbamoyladenosine biosynthesis protein TsaE